MRAGVMVVALALWGMAGAARAEGIVLESYTGTRPDAVTGLLAPLHGELAARGFVAGDSLGRQFEARVSRPARAHKGLSSEFEVGVERGHKAWIAGRFDDAVATLVPLIAEAHANPAAIAQNQAVRDKLRKALVALALAQQRKGDVAAAKETLREVLRSFPDAQLSRATYGPDAYELFDEVRRAAGQGGRGRLTIKVPTDQAVVFVNERFENVGTTSKADLIPGPYRVYIQIGKRTSRVHHVAVKRDEETVLVIDAAYDDALDTSGTWTGFRFANRGQRERLEVGFATRFATAIGATAAVVVGIDVARNGPALVGSLVDLRSAKEIRRASLALDPPPTAERVRALARFLGGDEATEGIDVEIGGAAEAATPTEPRGGDRRWMLLTGVAAVAVGVAGGGALAVKFAVDANEAGDELVRVCETSCSAEQVRALQQEQRAANRNAVIAGIAGGAVAVGGVVFIVLSRRARARSTLAITPTRSGLHASWGISF